jgi:type VI secretion system secreted protein VgrG
MFDDTKDNEHVTLQHRSGTMIQLLPDGGFQIVSHKGRYDVTYGENRITVTGSQDTTVDGDHSTKVKGNQNSTVYGDQISAVRGHSVMTAKSENKVIAEHSDSVIGTKTEKINNNATTQTMGSSTLLSRFGMTVASTQDSLALGGKNQVGVKSGTETILESGGKFSLTGAAAGAMLFGAKLSVKAGGAIALDGATVRINCNDSDSPDDIKTVFKQAEPPQPTPEPQFDVA